MAQNPRRFDTIGKVVSDTRRQQDDTAATALMRIATHIHPESAVTNLTTDLAGKQARSTLTAKGDLYVATASGTTTRQGVGSDNQILIADSSQATGIRYTSLIVSDVWQFFTFFNGWFDNGNARFRMMPDGYVQYSGFIAKNSIPTNGEVVFTVPSAYIPGQRHDILCACPFRTYNGSQKLGIQTDGTVKIWDMSTTQNGDVDLSSIRYPVI